jgi:oligopeptide transport system ATP-binding protein
MYLGRVVEIASRDDLYQNPRHPYTQALLSAVPEADVDAENKKQRIVLQGEIPSPLRVPSGCRFHTRCPSAMAQCKTQDPVMSEHGGGHAVACHLYA